MPYVITTATLKLSKLKKRIKAIPGGTSAGKTIGIEQILIDKAQTDKVATLTSIVSESIPHIKRGCLRDFKNMMMSHHYWKDSLWNATDSIYTFETGSQVEFFSIDNPDKLRGGRRDRLFINEANNVPFDAFEQLEVRTKEEVWLDWNPSSEFWYYTEVKGKRDDVEEITLTYKDNEALSDDIIRSIEQRKNRASWWNVYGEGKLGEVEGKIYKNWETIDDIPHEARLERYGLDFGYTNDPSVIVAIYKYNGGYILDEIVYQTGMSNREIVDTLKVIDRALVIADSAEPKSIDEIKSYGINIQPAMKGQGSVRTGISFVQAQRIWVTRRSASLLKSYRNYLWEVDSSGKVLNAPAHLWSDGMDAVRYGLSSFKPQNDDVIQQQTQMFQRNIGRSDLRSAK